MTTMTTMEAARTVDNITRYVCDRCPAIDEDGHPGCEHVPSTLRRPEPREIGGRLGTFRAPRADLVAMLGEPAKVAGGDEKVTVAWYFTTAIGGAVMRDYWWNAPDEWSLAGESIEAVEALSAWLTFRLAQGRDEHVPPELSPWNGHCGCSRCMAAAEADHPAIGDVTTGVFYTVMSKGFGRRDGLCDSDTDRGESRWFSSEDEARAYVHERYCRDVAMVISRVEYKTTAIAFVTSEHEDGTSSSDGSDDV